MAKDLSFCSHDEIEVSAMTLRAPESWLSRPEFELVIAAES